MNNSDARNENFKQIEDIIDARKLLGYYNIHKQNRHRQDINKKVKFDETSLVGDKESYVLGINGVRHTDSEITIVKVKCTCTDVICRIPVNKWDMNDIAIPGDGTHLGESPSMVNLATLVTQNVQCEGDDEYLVPLSSWDPLGARNDDAFTDTIKCFSDTMLREKFVIRPGLSDPNIFCRSENSLIDVEFEETLPRRANGANKFSNFWHKQWRKPNVEHEPESTDS